MPEVRQLDRLVEVGAIRPVRLTSGGHRRFRIIDLAALVASEETKEAEEILRPRWDEDEALGERLDAEGAA